MLKPLETVHAGGLLDQDRAVRAVVERLQEAFNAHDWDAVAANYREDAPAVNVLGMRFAGRQEIADFLHSPRFPAKDRYVRYETVNILHLREDVSIANVLQTPTDAQGKEIEGQKVLMLLVIAKAASDWKIAASQMTFVGDRA